MAEPRRYFTGAGDERVFETVEQAVGLQTKEDRMHDTPTERGVEALERIEELLDAGTRPAAHNAEIREQLDAAREALTARRTGADYLHELGSAHREFELVAAEREVLIGVLLEAAPDLVRQVFEFASGSDARETLEELIRRRAHRLLVEREHGGKNVTSDVGHEVRRSRMQRS